MILFTRFKVFNIDTKYFIPDQNMIITILTSLKQVNNITIIKILNKRIGRDLSCWPKIPPRLLTSSALFMTTFSKTLRPAHRMTTSTDGPMGP